MVLAIGNVVTEHDSDMGDRAHLPSFANCAGKMFWIPTGPQRAPSSAPSVVNRGFL